LSSSCHTPASEIPPDRASRPPLERCRPASYDGTVTGASWYRAAMPTIPLQGSVRDGRRAGPFWIEDGDGLVWFGDAVIALVLGLYVLAVVLNGA